MLTSLDLSGLNDLNYLACHNNELTSLNISGLTLLEFLVCSNNRLTALDLVGLDSLTAFYGDDQAASLTLYGNGESYVGRVAMGEGATFGSSSLSYDRSVGKLTSTDRNAGSSMFTSPTGKEGMNLTGTLTLRYADKSTPTKDDLDYQLEAVLGASNVYNGNPQPIDHCRAAGGVTGLGSITIYYEGANGTVYEKSDTPPTEAGAYAVSVDIAEGETYTSASGIGLGTYTIVKASDPPVGGNPDGNPNGGGQTATQPAVKTDISGATVTVAEPVSWTGRQITPKVKVELGGRALTEGMDYTVSYGANKNIGRGSVTVSGSGDYAGAKTAEFKILPQKVKLSKIKAAKGQLKITWKKAKAAQKLTGYQIRYRASQGKSWGKWKTKTVTVGKKALTIKRLAKGKKYQVQIRAYKKIGKEKYCAPWSATKKSGRVK
jgi:hypothetical protein